MGEVTRVPRWHDRGMRNRIAVAGASGAGKTTLAVRIAAATGLPRTEIDALFHGPDWTPRPDFLGDVRALVAGDRWVVEWQYDAARPLILDRADTVVWVDLPTRIQMARVVRRTVRRRWRHEELWNGNREPSLRTIFTDPDHVIRWAWRTRNRLRTQLPALAAEHPDVEVIRLRNRSQIEAFLASLGSQSG